MLNEGNKYLPDMLYLRTNMGETNKFKVYA